MTAHAHAAPAMGVWPLTLTWLVMMAAMMAPVAWPWLRAFHRFNGTDHDASVGATARFGSGYLLAWLGYASAAALLQRMLERASLFRVPGDALVSVAGAVVFLIAGAYQFAPIKRACLTHCRTPFGYFLTRWRDGPIGAVRMGFHHGLFCVGCCWALMATAFAVGVMNVWWMAALAVLALAEQIAPHGDVLRRALGGALLLAGIWRLAV